MHAACAPLGRGTVMLIAEPDYDTFAEENDPNRVLVHQGNFCTFWTVDAEQPLLVLRNSHRRRVAVFAYETTVRPTQDAKPFPPEEDAL